MPSSELVTWSERRVRFPWSWNKLVTNILLSTATPAPLLLMTHTHRKRSDNWLPSSRWGLSDTDERDRAVMEYRSGTTVARSRCDPEGQGRWTNSRGNHSRVWRIGRVAGARSELRPSKRLHLRQSSSRWKPRTGSTRGSLCTSTHLSFYLYLSRKHKNTIWQSHTADRTVRARWYWTLP